MAREKGIERGVEERIAAKTGVIDAADSNGLAAAEYDDGFGEPVRVSGVGVLQSKWLPLNI